MNLDFCKNVKITVNTPVNLDSQTVSLYNSLSESGYNLFDSNDPYYNDVCSTYTTENGTDIALFDRQKELMDFNISMCQSGCIFVFYNSTTKKSKCDCDAQTKNISTEIDLTNLNFNKNLIIKSFFIALKNSNIMILKCYKNAIDLNSLFTNIGRIIMTVILFIYLILLFIFIIKDRKNNDIFINSVIQYKKRNQSI